MTNVIAGNSRFYQMGRRSFWNGAESLCPSYPMLLLAHYLDRFRCLDDFPESYPRFNPPASSHTHTHTYVQEIERPGRLYPKHISQHTTWPSISRRYLSADRALSYESGLHTHPYSTIDTFGRFGCTSESGLRDGKKRKKKKTKNKIFHPA